MKSKILIALIAILFASCASWTDKENGVIKQININIDASYKSKFLVILDTNGGGSFQFYTDKTYNVGDTVYFVTSKELIK